MRGSLHDVMHRSDDLRRANCIRVLQAVRNSAPISRTDLAQRTQLSPATISTIINDLFASGAVRLATDGKIGDAQSMDTTVVEPRRGRPQVSLELNPKAGSVLTLALSLNQANIRVVDFTGALIAEDEARLETLNAASSQIIQSLSDIIASTIARLPANVPPVLQISMGVQGVTDIGNRAMLWSPIAKGDVALADGLEQTLGLPVTIANDCDVTALALQAMQGAGGGGDFVAITHTRGIGMSMVIGGRLFSGVRSSAAEFGHMVFEHEGALCRCGRRGCIEAYAGDYAIWRKAMGLSSQSQPLTEIDRRAFQDIVARAEAGDGPERDAFRAAAVAIGVGLKNLYALIDPAPLSMVGFNRFALGITGPLLNEILNDVVSASRNDPIDISWHGDADDLILRGAAARGLDLLEQRIAAATAGGSLVSAAE
jgi:predicted NBD/HSP70 family sugar kinase